LKSLQKEKLKLKKEQKLMKNKNLVTCEVILATSPASLDKISVLLVFASCAKAFTYCSATLSAAAFSPELLLKTSPIILIPVALASDLAIMARASPLKYETLILYKF
jgi:hypothetical protein